MVEEDTVKGHLNQSWQGIQSTQKKDDNVDQEPDNTRTQYISATIADMEATIYTDQTGKILQVSSRGK
eukprot:6664080-Ditylum_brightwellii.AAC.2